MAASSERGVALERDGHGLFTFALLEALDGRADDDQDGRIDIEELTGYLRKRVDELSDRAQQVTVPESREGEPFDLAEVGR